MLCGILTLLDDAFDDFADDDSASVAALFLLQSPFVSSRLAVAFRADAFAAALQVGLVPTLRSLRVRDRPPIGAAAQVLAASVAARAETLTSVDSNAGDSPRSCCRGCHGCVGWLSMLTAPRLRLSTQRSERLWA
jgi:hypothetical protein